MTEAQAVRDVSPEAGAMAETLVLPATEVIVAQAVLELVLALEATEAHPVDWVETADLEAMGVTVDQALLEVTPDREPMGARQVVAAETLALPVTAGTADQAA